MNRLYKAITIAAIAIAIFCSFKACSYAKKLDNEIADKIAYQTREQTYKVRIKKDSTTIYTQKILQANQQAANAHSGERKTQTSVKAKIGVKIDNVVAEYTKPDTIIKYVGANCDSLLDAQAANTIPIGSKFSKVDKWYSLSGTLDTNSVKDISIDLTPGDISVVVSGRKGKESATISVQNPYIQLSNISSVKVKQKRKMFNVSAGVGYGSSTDLKPRPFIGVSLNKTLFRF